MKIDHTVFTSRNLGYINPETQKKINSSRVLIAGCGIGSQVAECAARTGFQNFTLVDGDTIDLHNLNRQFYFADQVGKLKAQALAENLLRINPGAEIQAVASNITRENAKALVSQCDLIFDTIDFLDLDAIVALHDEAHSQGKVLVSSFAVGFGAATLLISNSDRRPHSWIRDIFGLPATGDVQNQSYVERYMRLISSIATEIDPLVISVMKRVFEEMRDGRPCPAPQISSGAHEVAALAVTALLQHLAGNATATAPNVIITNLLRSTQRDLVNLLPEE